MAEEGEMMNVDDEVDEDYYVRQGENNRNNNNGEGDEDSQLLNVTDTSATQARRGKDIQGIPWERLNITREKHRQTRIEQYKNYENVPSSGEVVDKECKQMEKGGNFYEFWHNTRLVKPTILHFQLRNLVWATSKHDVYLMSNYSLIHWSSLSCKLSEVLNFSGHVAPNEKHREVFRRFYINSRIDTSIKNNLFGSLEVFNEKLHVRKGVSFCTKTTYDDNSITNAIDIFNGLRTCRVWDTRYLASPVVVLKGNLGAIRSIRLSSDGKFMAVAEPADFVHIYNTTLDYKRRQEIDFFGEISGISLSPDDESLFVGVWDRTYASLLHYGKRHEYSYLESSL
ncbi:hypothetical protein IFM89_024142 [Coptis chinensis]|uniref:Uncharacterized protein n=1 Tax=Coptis chinensis TaxID=261450 RepID=A0A835LWC2_9MAGN|nr:hypothetical protein IFM89_024142 [Coptis chinensis]